MTLFFCDNISDDTGILSPAESAHCLKVMRQRQGDVINVTDGRGNIYFAEITVAVTSGCAFRITGRHTGTPARNYKVHIAISPVKNTGRFEWFLEKASEIGVDTITPLICERTERPGLNIDRMHKILVSSVKQAGVPWLPQLYEATAFSDFITSLAGNERDMPRAVRLIGYCEGNNRAKITEVYRKGSDVIFMVGPEGDFSKAEVESAADKGFIAVTLGNTRLRTETAGIMACAAISILNF